MVVAIAVKRFFYSHVNFSVTKILSMTASDWLSFYSHVNFSVTKIAASWKTSSEAFTVT